MQKLILFCIIFFTIAACSKKTADNDPVLYQLKLSDFKGLWKINLPNTYIVPPYEGPAIFNLTIQDQHNFTINFPKGRTNGDTTINGTWELDTRSAGFKATYFDRVDKVEIKSGLIYKDDKSVLFFDTDYALRVIFPNGGAGLGPLQGNKQQ